MSSISPSPDWAMLEAPLADVTYAGAAPLPGFTMSPSSGYDHLDCGPEYFALPIPPVPTDFPAFDFGYHGSIQCPPLLSPGAATSPSTASRMSSLPTPPLIETVATPTPIKVESCDVSRLEAATKPENVKRKFSNTPPMAETTAPKPQSHLRTAKRVGQTSSRAGKTGVRSSPNQKHPQSGSPVTEELDSEVKARAAHNQVEQQYRQRLNAHFERLLAVLPVGDGPDEAGEMCGGGAEPDRRKVSKAEVLDLARRRIEMLEWEVRKLEREKQELLLGGSG